MSAKPKDSGAEMVRTTIIIPRALRADLKRQAAMEGTDVSRLLARLAQEYLSKKGGRK